MAYFGAPMEYDHAIFWCFIHMPMELYTGSFTFATEIDHAMDEREITKLLNDRKGLKVFTMILNLRKVSRDQLIGRTGDDSELDLSLEKLTDAGLIEMIPGPIQPLDVFIPTKEGLDISDEIF